MTSMLLFEKKSNRKCEPDRQIFIAIDDNLEFREFEKIIKNVESKFIGYKYIRLYFRLRHFEFVEVG